MECDEERMVATSISSQEILTLLEEALSKVQPDEGSIDLSQLQYYWSFDHGALFDTNSEPWAGAAFGDLHFDLYSLSIELQNGVSSPIMLLKTLSMVLYAISVSKDQGQ
ncbi:hypothetical protein [Ruegeria arenilitoris]|uniref:hypothetical protein n=1 Tax=Ruegeria arenilitoris TaxID=1173585 RepID=UPI00147BDD9B|nr:hypothetical protein [Ruegeria arenilitoris]